MPARSTPAPSFPSAAFRPVGARLARAVAEMIESAFEHVAQEREAQRLMRLSNAELARLGISRQGIRAYVRNTVARR